MSQWRFSTWLKLCIISGACCFTASFMGSVVQYSRRSVPSIVRIFNQMKITAETTDVVDSFLEPYATTTQPETKPLGPPFNSITGVNKDCNTVVFELTLSKDLGFVLEQGNDHPVVGKVSVAFYLHVCLGILTICFETGS